MRYFLWCLTLLAPSLLWTAERQPIILWNAEEASALRERIQHDPSLANNING